ncbi:MAG: hypothetical protein HeimC3_12750 [Candidatus Heimdallarchaeota archaeon LC_3]|nr:MAG: hypothetical protein HeimC3_12750 [Candidatus Heimdallarchaeota archaeon LC_3]
MNNNFKIIESLSDLESLIDQERKRPKYKKSVKIVEKPNEKPVVLDGSEIANYGTHGFPSMKNIKVVLEKIYNEGFTPITIINGSELRYLLLEHEKIKNLDKCHCEFCIAVKNQYIKINDYQKAIFLECLPEIDADVEILKISSNSGARIMSNKDFNKYRDKYAILANKNWQIRYKIENNDVIFKK